MSRVCEVCGKGQVIVNKVETRGRAKHLKGVGTKITGITRRSFLPNLHNVRVTLPNGATKTMRVCTQCLRCDAVVRKIAHKPFEFKSLSK